MDTETIWKYLATILVTIVITMFSAWVSIGRTAITKQEVRQEIAENSPYLRDKETLHFLLKDNVEQLKILKKEVEQLRLEQARLTERVEIVLTRTDNSR